MRDAFVSPRKAFMSRREALFSSREPFVSPREVLFFPRKALFFPREVLFFPRKALFFPRKAFVSPASACLIGLIAGFICFYAVALKNKLGWDDALDVWGVHGVGGFIGIILCGIFATTLFNPAGTDGLLRGGTRFFLIQIAAVLLSSVWAFVFTYGMLWLIDRITTVKVDEAGEAEGLDSSIHGEAAYLEGAL